MLPQKSRKTSLKCPVTRQWKLSLEMEQGVLSVDLHKCTLRICQIPHHLFMVTDQPQVSCGCPPFKNWTSVSASYKECSLHRWNDDSWSINGKLILGSYLTPAIVTGRRIQPYTGSGRRGEYPPFHSLSATGDCKEGVSKWADVPKPLPLINHKQAV